MSSAEVKSDAKPLAPDEGAFLIHPSMAGFYIRRGTENDWYFGRPKGSAISWEKVGLSDLLNLGVQLGDVENIAADRTYRARPTKILIEAT